MSRSDRRKIPTFPSRRGANAGRKQSPSSKNNKEIPSEGIAAEVARVAPPAVAGVFIGFSVPAIMQAVLKLSIPHYLPIPALPTMNSRE